MLPVVGRAYFQHLRGPVGKLPSCQGTAGAVSPPRAVSSFPLSSVFILWFLVWISPCDVTKTLFEK